ncbi:unnamed protein product [Clonostachys rosea]|uniref:C2H2-type domain-containing protein n=1 Tax=Bionectria ochroleuca TaxID=29856 RepID=A0ABY6UMJ3_BIOOC|nr:unnamed protein product [Clonostachys rosea]
MAIELLAFEGKLHSTRTNWACPFVCCKGNFPDAKALMRHVPFCEHFASRRVFCNMCGDYDCFETHEIPMSTPLSTQKRALRKFTKIFTRSEDTQKVSRPQGWANTVSQIDISESQRLIKMQSRPPFHSPDIPNETGELGGNPISELDDSLIPKGLHDPVHQLQMLPNVGPGPDFDAGKYSALHEMSRFQPQLHDTTATIDCDMENELDQVYDSLLLNPLSHHDSGRETPARNLVSQESQTYVEFLHPRRAPEPLRLSTKQLSQALPPDIEALITNHQTGSQDPTPTTNCLSGLGSQPPIEDRVFNHSPQISIPLLELPGDPWPLPVSENSTVLPPPSSASQSLSRPAIRFSSFVPVSRRAHQFNTSLESPITANPQDGQTLKCIICDYIPQGPKKNHYTYLKKHLNMHTQRKNPCPVCGIEFTRKDNLRVHMQSLHSGLRAGGAKAVSNSHFSQCEDDAFTPQTTLKDSTAGKEDDPIHLVAELVD